MTASRESLAIVDGTHRPLHSRRLGIDGTLLAGLVAILALLLLALYGPIIAAHDPFETHAFYKGKVPPFDPTPEFPLGTDALGRDRLSWLLYGARMTFVIALSAAAIRVVVGIFLGIFAAVQGGAKELYLSRIALALSSVPATIGACLGVLAFNVNAGALAFILGLSVIGWADAFQHARRGARAEFARPYIDSARSLGLSDRRIVLAHLIPNLAPNLLTIASLQVSAVLLLLGELALLRLFFGGPVSSDLYGTVVVLPSEPEWASTLGATRPVTDLYGNPLAVVVPAAALLFSVIAFNLFGDALARRAQQLDVFHLFSRAQSIALVLGSLVIVLPAILWPSRLADELGYADGFDTGRAASVMRELAREPYDDRIVGSAQASSAAARLADMTGGSVSAISESIAQVKAATVSAGGRQITLGTDVAPLSRSTATATGALVLIPTGSRVLIAPSSGRIAEDNIAVLRDLPGAALPTYIRALSQYHIVGLVWVSDEGLIETDDYGIPVVRVSSTAIRDLLGSALPTLSPSDAASVLTSDARVDVRIDTVTVNGQDAIARVPSGRTGAPIFLVAAPYDQASYPHYLSTRPGWASASASGVLAASSQYVRSHPLSADVVFVAAGAESFDHAGLKTALRALTDDERSRLVAVVVVSNAVGAITTIRPDLSLINNPGGGPSIAGRVASATGQRFGAQRSLQFQRAVVAAGARAPIIELVSASLSEAPPPDDALKATGRTLLVLLDYLAHHPEQLQP